MKHTAALVLVGLLALFYAGEPVCGKLQSQAEVKVENVGIVFLLYKVCWDAE